MFETKAKFSRGPSQNLLWIDAVARPMSTN